MHNEKALVILSPAFAGNEADSKMPSQEILVRTFNRLYPSLKIIVLTFHFPIKKEREYEWHGNRIITANGAMKGGLHSPLLWLRIWKQLRNLHQTYQIIGLFSFFCSECAFIGHYFAKRNKLKHRIWVMGQDAKKENYQVKRIRPASDELVALSDFLQREFERNHHIRPKYVIPIGIDASLFVAPVRHRDIDLLGAGSLIPLKQFEQFVDVAHLVAQNINGINAFIVGNGSEEKNILNRIKTVNLEQQVRLTGKQPHPETLAMMQRCKIFLHTSSYEGLGVVCLEALYAGAKVISFCKPMDNDIPGWYIVNTKEEMAEKVIELLQGATSYKGIMPYNMEDTARNIIHLFSARATT